MTDSPRKAGSSRKRRTSDSSDEGPKRYRSETGISSVVAKHYNELEEKGLEAREESQIFHMRSFNNWIKSMLINDIVQRFKTRSKSDLTVLDMCCGKGGDILKWLKSNSVKHVVFADIAGVSVEQCKDRYNSMVMGGNRRNESRFSAEFITADCSKDRLRDYYASPETLFDLVSVQFSFHYSFESLSQAQTMLRNIAENLKPGGYFVGTIPNAARIVRMVRASGGKLYSNPVFRIEFEGPEPYPLFGAKYFFQLEQVVNCPEFLVHFGTLEKLATTFGLRLLYRKTFDEFYHEKQSEGHFLLERMRALETYPPPNGTKLSFRNIAYEYAHAEKLYNEGQSGGKPFGTLAKSEWEAVSLYIAFAFEKV